MKIYVIRHGETEYNKKGCLQGWLDIPLNENGEKTAILTGEGLKDVAFDYVFTSPLKRAYRTAELVVAGGTSNPPFICDDRLREISWGEWEGLGCTDENMEVNPEIYFDFYRDCFHFSGAPGGESIVDNINRMGDFYQDILGRKELADKTILVSTHGCATRALLHHVYEDKSDYWHGCVPANCVVNIIEVKDGVGTLVGDDILYYDESLAYDPYKLR